MGFARIVVVLEENALARVDRLVREGKFPSRSRPIQDAVAEKLVHMRKTRLATECAKLEPELERALADEGLSEELATWPEY